MSKINPLHILPYGSSDTFTAFNGSSFAGWLVAYRSEWVARPVGWKAHGFKKRGQAVRYLISSLKPKSK